MKWAGGMMAAGGLALVSGPVMAASRSSKERARVARGSAGSGRCALLSAPGEEGAGQGDGDRGRWRRWRRGPGRGEFGRVLAGRCGGGRGRARDREERGDEFGLRSGSG